MVKFDCSNKHYLIFLSIFQIAFLDQRGLRNPNCTVRSRCCYLFSRFIKSHRYVCGHYVLQCWYLCGNYLFSSVLVCLRSSLMFFIFGMSVVITHVLQCWYVCGHYLCSSLLVCLWSLLMFFSVGMSVAITYVLQCWYVCGHYLCSSVLVCLWSLLIFFGTDWFEWPLAQIQVKFPWQLILIIQLTPYNSNPRFNSNLALLTRTKVDFPLISFMNTCTFTVILHSVSQTLDN